MKRLLVSAGIILCAGVAHAGDGCTCRYKGGDVFEGQTACITTAKGPTLARCERVLNNTSWKMLDQPCPTAGLMSAPARHGEPRWPASTSLGDS